MVLGIEWLVTLGDITWNFDRLSMQFYVHGKKLVLRGATSEGLKIARKKQLQKTIASSVHLSMLHVGTETNTFLLQSLITHANCQVIPNSIEKLLGQFEDIFQEPTTLSPKMQGHDHKIPLVAGANPINKWPYRYAKHQKDIIDKLVQDSLQSGIIQKSCIPFASPVVLVGKKDGTWRLCVDYLDLNQEQIPYSFGG